MGRGAEGEVAAADAAAVGDGHAHGIASGKYGNGGDACSDPSTSDPDVAGPAGDMTFRSDTWGDTWTQAPHLVPHRPAAFLT